MSDSDPPEENQPTDYTGLKIAAILAPLFLIFIYFGKADTGLTVFVVLGVTMLAIKIRWNLSKHVWFWAVIVFMLALHIPLFLIVRWPQEKLPTIFYTMPLGIVDFLIISGALGLAEKLLSRDSSSNAEKE